MHRKYCDITAETSAAAPTLRLCLPMCLLQNTGDDPGFPARPHEIGFTLHYLGRRSCLQLEWNKVSRGEGQGVS